MKPADIDLRAEVLAGIDQQIKYNETADLKYALEVRIGNQGLKALRHLREIVNMHDGFRDGPLWRCDVCGTFQAKSCPTLVSLAPDYAPQALAQMEVDRGK